MKNALIFCLFCGLAASAKAQSITPSPAGVPPPQDSQSQFASILASNISQLLANTDVLKQQIEALREENAKLKVELQNPAPRPHADVPPPSVKP